MSAIPSRSSADSAIVPRLPFLVGLILMVAWSGLRIGLLVWNGLDQVPLSLWPRVLVFGLWFDFAVAATLVAPVCLYEALLPNRWRQRPWHRALRIAWLALAIGVILFGLVAEITFWLEFSTRFNFIAVDYLIYTQEVIGNIRQSYPVGWILAGIGAVALGLAFSLRRPLAWADGVAPGWRARLALVAAGLALPAALLWFASVDQMEGSGNTYADELSGNGLFSLAAAMRRNELDYDRFYQTMPQEQADAVLAELRVARQPLTGQGAAQGATQGTAQGTTQGTTQGAAQEASPAALKAAPSAPSAPQSPAVPSPFKARPRNVVLITVESLSALYVGAWEPPKLYAGLTPELDKLAREGLMFEHLYATGTRTVRGLEALSLGTPPVPGQSIVRRPGNEDLATVGGLLGQQGYTSMFLYGGYGYFDNMNAYYAANHYRVVDRTDIPRKDGQFENIWGVADEVLFDRSLELFDAEAARGKPFFAQLMTTSNHRPFTYPSGRIDIPSPGGREGGVKYTDWAIGKFLRDAQSRPWFKDTLFVIVADHCASAAGKSKLPPEGYHIPMIFYAPALLTPGRYKPLASQIDLAPTLLDVLGKKGAENFFGRSYFSPEGPAERVFISNYQELGYLRNGMLTVLSPRQRVATFAIDPESQSATPVPVDARLRDEAVAYYQTAARAFKRGALRLPGGAGSGS